MASRGSIKFHKGRGEYSRKEILESLFYELKPFAIVGFGFILALYFSHAGAAFASLGKFSSLTLLCCGLFILYWRAKDRGVIQ